ncbi:MAG: hypothetical protein ACRBBR_03185 [Cellvibrionaceae bacterium]
MFKPLVLALCSIFSLQFVMADTLLQSKDDIADIHKLEKAFLAKPNTLNLYQSLTSIKTKFGTFKVLPARFEPIETPFYNSYRCGLVFIADEGARDTLITVGVGMTEVLSCDGLIEMGTLEDGNGTKHLGMIYHFRSPNVDFKGPLVVSMNAKDNSWYVNEKLSADASATEAITTINALKNKIKAVK